MAALSRTAADFSRSEQANIADSCVNIPKRAVTLDSSRGQTNSPAAQDWIATDPATVLVVEDFDETRFILKLSLELSGYRVIEAVNGQEAVNAAHARRPDLILMDIGLPIVDGYTATRSIRENPELCDVPIVAITAHASAECRDKAIAAGCSAYITKPIDFDHLEKLLLQLLNKNVEVSAGRSAISPTVFPTYD